MKYRSGLFKNLLSVSGILIFVKALGFVKQMVIAAVFGANAETDLISLSYGFIGDAQYLLVQVLLTAVVSVYIYAKEQKQCEAQTFASDALKVGTVASVAVSLVIFVGAQIIARFLAPTYTPEASERLGGYIRLFAPMLIPFVWIAVFHALLNANKRFIPGQLEGFYQSVIVITMVPVCASVIGVNALAVGYWLYALVSAGILGVQAHRYFGKSRGNPFCNPYIHRLVRMIGPLLIGYGAVYINQMVDKILVSGLESGSVTAMNYAAVLSNLVGTLTASLCAVLYAHLTEHISRGDTHKVAQLTERAALLLTVLLLPVTIVAVSHARDIVSLIYGRGAFEDTAVEKAAHALMGYSLGYIPLALREIYSRVQYGYQDTRWPTINSLIGIACNIILSIVLCPSLGVFGVTFASSLSTLLIGILNMRSARKDAPFLSFYMFRKFGAYLLLGCGMAVLIAMGCIRWFENLPVYLRLCLGTVCVFSAYFVVLGPYLWKNGYLPRRQANKDRK